MTNTKFYHGTTSYHARKIEEDQRFKPSKKSNEWLGHGVYFFRYKKHADNWAVQTTNRHIERSKNEKYSPPKVIVATIVCESDKYINLDISEEMKKFDDCIYPFIEGMKRSGSGSPAFKDEKERLCYFVNVFVRLNSIKVIEYSFQEEKSQVKATGFVNRQPQVCVYDSDCIEIESVEEVVRKCYIMKN